MAQVCSLPTWAQLYRKRAHMKIEQLHRTIADLTDKFWRATRTKRIAIEERIDTSDPDSQAFLAYMETACNPNNITVEDVAREIRALEEQVPDFGIIYLGQFRGGFGLYPRAQEGCLNTVEEWAEALSRYAIADAEYLAEGTAERPTLTILKGNRRGNR